MMGQILSIMNAVFVVVIYTSLVTLLVVHINKKIHGKSDGPDKGNGSSGDGGNDGGWENADKTPPLDLPPGVFILPPDAPDPSAKKKDQLV